MFLTDFTDLHRFVIARTARRYDEAGRSNQLSTLNSQLSILSTAYWPPVQYFAHIAAAGTVLLEQHENYQKQSYRNRCMIYAANGPTPLIIPVVKLPGGKMPVRDVRIDYATPWQRVHWKAIVSAYRSSAFFAYYEDDLRPFYEKEERFLFDFNEKILRLALELAGLNTTINYTDCRVVEC